MAEDVTTSHAKVGRGFAATWDLWLAGLALAMLGTHAFSALCYDLPGRVIYNRSASILPLLVPAALLALLAKAASQSRRPTRLFLGLLVLGLAGSLSIGPASIILFRASVHQELSRGNGLRELQNAAVAMLSQQRTTEKKWKRLSRRDPSLPEVMRRLQPGFVQVDARTGDPRVDHVSIVWGSGFGHWALAVGGPKYSPSPPLKDRWCEGVYWGEGWS